MVNKRETEVMDALQAFSERVASRDLEGVIASFAQSPGVLLIGSEAGEVAQGPEELREFFVRIFARPVRFSWQWSRREVVVNGAMAWLYADGAVSLRNEDGLQQEQPYRITGVLIRENEQWHWVQYHGSVPAGEVVGKDAKTVNDDKDWALDRYLIEIRNQSSIPKNETDLLEAAREGDKKARLALVRSYLAITAELGLRLAPPSMAPLQAVEEANLVLLRLIGAGVEKPAVELGPAIHKHLSGLT